MPSLHSLFGMRRKSDAPPPSARASADASPEDITRKLAMMTISPQPQAQMQVQAQSHSRPPPRDGQFVGGFHPAMVGGNVSYAAPAQTGPTFPGVSTPPHPGPPPVPPKIVTTSPVEIREMSRTMEYALSSPNLGASGPSGPSTGTLPRPPLDVSRPRSDPAVYMRPQADRVQPVKPLPLFRDGDDPITVSAPPRPSSSRLLPPSLQVPISYPRGRSTSSPATSPSSDLPSKVNCSGFTKAGKQCKRQIDRSALTTDESTWYCHQHEPEILKNKKFRLQNGDFDDYKSFIPEYLSPNTQANLRNLMESAISDKDEDGYIYIHQILDADNYDPNRITYKAGRTVKPKQRNTQWRSQCPSTEKHIVHIHPASNDQKAQRFNAAHLNPGPPGICCHRLEAFVLAELRDLERYEQYLHPLFRDGTSDFVWNDLDASIRTRPRPVRVPCVDCKKLHNEIFTFTRVRSGPLAGKELENVLIPVINRWANFLFIQATRNE